MIALSCAGIFPAAFNSKTKWQALHLWTGSVSPIILDTIRLLSLLAAKEFLLECLAPESSPKYGVETESGNSTLILACERRMPALRVNLTGSPTPH